MVPHFLQGLVLVSVIAHGTVVGAEYDERVLLEVVFLEGFDEFAHAPVELDDDVSSVAQTRFATEAFVWNARYVKVMGGKEEEEGMILILGDPLVGFLDPLVGQVLVAEAGGMTPGVKTNPTDTVVDGRVVTVAPVHLQRVPMGDARRVVRARFLAADPEGVLGIQIEYAMVLDVDLRHSVIGGGEQETVAKPYL